MVSFVYMGKKRVQGTGGSIGGSREGHPRHVRTSLSYQSNYQTAPLFFVNPTLVRAGSVRQAWRALKLLDYIATLMFGKPRPE